MTTDPKVLTAITQAELAKAIRDATHEVFSTMLTLEVVAGEVFTEKQEAAPATGVVSLIGLAGSWVGTGSLSCSAQSACWIASHLLMTEYDGITDDVLDAVAEVTNMIIGNVKTVLEESLGGMGLSTPTVIYGHNFQTRSARNQDWTVVPFTAEGERLCVQVCIAPNRDAEPKQGKPGYPIPHLLNI